MVQADEPFKNWTFLSGFQMVIDHLKSEHAICPVFR